MISLFGDFVGTMKSSNLSWALLETSVWAGEAAEIRKLKMIFCVIRVEMEQMLNV